MFRAFILKHEKKIHRLLEILPGFVSYNVILFPYWGTFYFPVVVAYFVLGYNIYWFYQSFQIAITGILSHLRTQASMRYDWKKDLTVFPDADKVRHLVIIPTYKEPLHILDRTFKSLINQTLPKKQMLIILAMEAKEGEKERKEKVKTLKEKYGDFFVTTHTLTIGEVVGKASNERYAAVWAKKELIDKKGLDINYVVVTSCDADHVYHPNHFAALTFKFLDDPARYKRFWQPAVLFYNNIWEIPAITRIVNIFGSLWNLSLLPRRDRLISTANYSLSMKLLHEVGYWDADKISEDWGIFFKSYYKSRGGVEVEPIYLPVYGDAAQSTTTLKTLKSQYEQMKRWAWGVSDDPWIIKDYFLTPGVSFWEKTARLFYLIQSHFLWPVHWFVITIGLQIPMLLNPAFGRTALGYTVPRLSSIVLTVALVFLVILIFLDRIYRPQRPDHIPAWRAFLSPLEFLLMPISGFFFSALPGLDAHTRLMLGRYLEYKVTEKV
ncbi:glycosyltransferase family 2 protein [Patescibacteria group bacterium]|nr:glycosyltransferase family 2 protein [Patescibacteria group bacterium]